MTDFSTEALLADRFEGETYASSHYIRVAKALAEASEAWKAVANATNLDESQITLLKSRAIKAGAYALTLTNKPIA
jgi:hypothetical protein